MVITCLGLVRTCTTHGLRAHALRTVLRPSCSSSDCEAGSVSCGSFWHHLAMALAPLGLQGKEKPWDQNRKGLRCSVETELVGNKESAVRRFLTVGSLTRRSGASFPLRSRHTGHSYGTAGKVPDMQAESPEPRSLIPKASHASSAYTALPAPHT